MGYTNFTAFVEKNLEMSHDEIRRHLRLWIVSEILTKHGIEIESLAQAQVLYPLRFDEQKLLAVWRFAEKHYKSTSKRKLEKARRHLESRKRLQPESLHQGFNSGGTIESDKRICIAETRESSSHEASQRVSLLECLVSAADKECKSEERLTERDQGKMSFRCSLFKQLNSFMKY